MIRKKERLDLTTPTSIYLCGKIYKNKDECRAIIGSDAQIRITMTKIKANPIQANSYPCPSLKHFHLYTNACIASMGVVFMKFLLTDCATNEAFHTLVSSSASLAFLRFTWNRCASGLHFVNLSDHSTLNMRPTSS